MRVFVTGATGFIGSAVVRELIQAGHRVLGLARSDAGAKSLLAAGAQVQHGDLLDLESLKQGVAAADGVIHTAFIHDFSKFQESCETDRRVIETFGTALAGSRRPLVVTSGTALLTPGRLAFEKDAPPADAFPRVASEQAAASVAARGAHVSVVRLAPSVHGDGDHAFIPFIIGFAREKGASAYVGEGQNRWPAVHRFDAARLFRLALEKGAAGAHYHGAAEEGVPFREIAAVVARRLDLPLVSKTPAEADCHFSWFAHFAAVDNPTSSQWTRETLGWRPQHPGLIADIDRPGYFAS